MTVPSTQRRAGPFSGNGVTTSFPFTFKVFAAEDVEVVKTGTNSLETTLVLNSDYSVSINFDQDASPGGTITYPISGSPLASGEKLTLVGNLDYEQTTNLTQGGAFSPTVIEDTFDRTVIQIQQLEEEVTRALRMSVSTTASGELPAAEAGKLIGWDQLGAGFANYDAGDLFSNAVYADWKYDVLTGTGAATSFTLQNNPGNIANLDVSIDGVVQVPSADYTVSGTVLTFTSAPGLGQKIFARYGQAAQQVSSTFSTETQTATASQTVFDLTSSSYLPGNNNLGVYVNGLRLVAGVDFTETDSNTVTMTSGLTAGDEVVFVCGRTLNDSVGAEAVSFVQAGTGAVARSAQSKLRDTVDVRDYGASTAAAAADNSAAINAAIQANLSGEIRIAETYTINASINLNGFRGTIQFAGNGSGLKAGANNLKVFQSTTNAYGCRIIDARVDGNGYTGVYAFDLTRFQLDGAQIVRPVIVSCEYGIYLRSLCWGLKIENPDCALVNYPITLVEGCNAVLIDHPSIDTFGAAGIWIKTGGAYPNVGNMILNGFVQNGTEGIVDQGIQTQVVGTYLEGNSVADISLKTGSVYFYGGVTNHTAGGARAYRSSNADSAMIVHPVMSSGGRTIGLLDFDGTNTNCYYDAIFGAGSRNLPIGVTTGIQPISNKPGPIGGITPNTGAFTTLSASGSASLTGGVNTGKGVVSAAASGAASTIFTIGAGNRGRYDIVAMIANSGAANLYTVFATVVWDGTGARIVANNTANMTLTLSGANVQATQSSGSANDIYWSYLLTSIA